MGTVTGSLTVVSTASNSPVTIALTGTGIQPQISVVPTSISFANVSVNVTNTQSLTIKNAGTATLTVSQASLAGTSFTYSTLALPLSLAPGASSAFTVAFTPASASSRGRLSAEASLPRGVIRAYKPTYSPLPQ